MPSSLHPESPRHADAGALVGAAQLPASIGQISAFPEDDTAHSTAPLDFIVTVDPLSPDATTNFLAYFAVLRRIRQRVDAERARLRIQ